MIPLVLSVGLIGMLVLSGPRLILIRAVLRAGSTAQLARALAPKAAYALAVVLVFGAGLAGYLVGGEAVLEVALLAVLVALAVMDFAWRWLPLEWIFGLGVAGGVLAFDAGQVPEALMSAGLAAAMLAIPRFVLGWLRGQEMMGLGDVFLAAALGLYTDLLGVVWVLSLAAICGLITHFLLKLVDYDRGRTRLGVAFGAHMALVFALMHII